MRTHRIKPIVKAVSLALTAGTSLAVLPALAQERVEITGSRILKLDLQSSSPMVTVTANEIVGRQDVSLDTALNTLPQVNPAGTTTSNNPGNGGQSNVNLRGLGGNRNLVLLDGRRAMVSDSTQRVDLNTIPLALIDSVEIITGGAGAVYGADAVAGVVNVKLKRRFDGLSISAGHSDSAEFRDARETSLTLLGGKNFDGNRGNAVLYFDYAKRQQLIKSQRSFAAVATATTSFFPEGTYRPTGNAPTQAAVDALFSQASYRNPVAGSNPNNIVGGLLNYAAGDVPAGSALAFNNDGTLIYPGIFNSPRDVRNWRYPVDTGVNTRIFPDVYSYNFDAVNILQLPLQRYSIGMRADYSASDKLEIFARAMFTNYSSRTALAPTPVPTVQVRAPGTASPIQATSAFVTPGQTVANELIVPVTNPFIPADLAALLASRAGDSPALVGSGATEPFRMRWRTVGAGLREANYRNDVSQMLLGAKGELTPMWSWEAYGSYGRTAIANTQTGNIDTNRLLQALAAPDGGRSLCAGGVNPFGRQPLSASCSTFLSVDNTITNTFTQKIALGYLTGELGKLPGGPVSTVFGAELRDFSYNLNPGTASGPISGFNTQTPAGGTNQFRDLFAEVSLPLARKASWAQSLDLTLAARSSQSEFEDTVANLASDKQRSNTFAINLTYQPVSSLRVRGSVQRAVRAPNFTELFDGGGSAPQYFDPCSVTSAGRTGRTGLDAAQLRVLCRDVGTANGGAGLGSNVDTYVQTPGTQASVTLTGNTKLKPETGTSYTLGLVFAAPDDSALKGLTASIDYYNIRIKDAIESIDTNELIADCYNYYGRNPGYLAGYSSCAGITRGGDIVFVTQPLGDDFAGTNGGRYRTDGIDIGLGWRGNLGPGVFNANLNLTHLLTFKLRTDTFLPEQEFAGTIPYFGAGLGQAFPKTRAVLNLGYDFGAFEVSARYRYFTKMINRMEKLFPGEKFTGTPATGYLDLGFGYEFAKGMSVSVGVNNALDQEPRTYQPNVQSGTDPSTFDVIGRRYYVRANLQF
jgi:outer membrane receptor protein involved in Fe transport